MKISIEERERVKKWLADGWASHNQPIVKIIKACLDENEELTWAYTRIAYLEMISQLILQVLKKRGYSTKDCSPCLTEDNRIRKELKRAGYDT